MDANENSGKGTYVQTVTIEVEVEVNADGGNFNEVTVMALRAGIERHVREEWLGSVAMNGPVVGVHAQQGPGGSRYWFPGETVETRAPLALNVGLGDLSVPTVDPMENSDPAPEEVQR